MIDFGEAYKLVIKNAVTMPVEKIPFTESSGRILAADIHSDMDMPPFNKSAMDGYACKMADISGPLRVIETVPAGKVPEKKVEPGTCTKIMTGAPVPEGADCVIMVEKTRSIDPNTIQFTEGSTAGNICFMGEDIKAGDTVLQKGTCIRAQEIAVLASAGCTEVNVFRKPRIGIIASGSELHEPGGKLPKGAIRDSNSYQLAAQVEKSGATARRFGIVKDTPAEIQKAIRKLEKDTDIILISGGVSAGDFDLVPSEIQKAGYEIVFHKVRIKPGMPLLFAVKNDKYCFGLPGNPVSTFVQFEYLIKPFICALMGRTYCPLQVNLPVGMDIKRKKTHRDTVIPVQIRNGKIQAMEYHGSAHINSLTLADGFIKIPRETEVLKKGESANVRFI